MMMKSDKLLVNDGIRVILYT